jgi:signal transduction histidine kinase
MALSRAPRRSDLLLVAAAAAGAAGMVLLGSGGWPEWVFGTFMLSALGLLARLGLESWRSAHVERERAERLRSIQLSTVAEQAVALERERLAGEVEECIHDALRQIADETENLDHSSPVPALQRVHALTRRTTSELRRQLGLLRESAAEEHARSVEVSPSRQGVNRRRALAEGLALACLAGIESTVWLLTEGPEQWLPWSVVVTMLAASTIAGRGSRPMTAVLVLAGLVTAGSVVGHPVASGFWIVVTLGVLLWTVAAVPAAGPGGALARVGTVVVLVGALTWAFQRDDPDNFGVLLVVVTVALLGGALVGAQRWGQERARRAAEKRERVLGKAADEAVRVERAVVARELHDVVSHAVGVIALQAGAAELSWPHDKAAVSRAVEVIRGTTEATLADLDRLPAPPMSAEHTSEHLLALVERVRLAGTAVDLTMTGDPSAHADIVHRVVQESLTNAMRHAPGAPVVVRVQSDLHHTEVSVSDDGPGPREQTRRGYGLVGLAERVEFAHGSLQSGPGPSGRGFRVIASIPSTSSMSPA